jgi:hypothetical protein
MHNCGLISHLEFLEAEASGGRTETQAPPTLKGRVDTATRPIILDALRSLVSYDQCKLLILGKRIRRENLISVKSKRGVRLIKNAQLSK